MIKDPKDLLQPDYSRNGPPLFDEPAIRIPDDDPPLAALYREHGDMMRQEKPRA